MGSRKRALLVTALLALVVTVSGCQTGPETSVPEETPTADELRQQTVDAMADVETASFTMDMAVEASGTSIEMSGDGEMDLPARRMRMNLDLSTGGQDISATQYVDGDTAYINVNDQWQRQDMSGQDIWANNQLTQQQEVLEGAEVRLNGTTTVDNRHVYRLEVEANESVVRRLLQQSAASTGSLENVEVSRLSFTQYVDVETKHVRRLDMQIDMAVQGQSATADMTMTFSNFDEDVTIEIPEEARNA